MSADLMFGLAGPVLRQLDPERAHDLTLAALEMGLHPRGTHTDPMLAIDAMGLQFPNPVGVAAGFDKDARVPDALLQMGFGFAEVGTLTPLPQAGNSKPRVFRLAEDHAVINRYGFNNCGHNAALKRLEARQRRGIVGVNLGANKDSTDRIADYVAGITKFYDRASYFTINISSPNTPGLRDLQAPGAVDELLARVMDERNCRADRKGREIPVVVKIAPDIALEDLGEICARILARGADAIAISNTTLARPASLVAPAAVTGEPGGLSGAPLFERATIMLAKVYRHTDGRIPLIGIGGIMSGADALAKIRAGATLIQVYTGLVFKGPGLLGEINRTLAEAAASGPGAGVADLVARDVADWAERHANGFS